MKLNTKILIVFSLVLILISQNLEARKLRRKKFDGFIGTQQQLLVI